MTAKATPQQMFYFDVNVVTAEREYSAQVSGTGRDFHEALVNAADTERVILTEEGDQLVSFELI